MYYPYTAGVVALSHFDFNPLYLSGGHEFGDEFLQADGVFPAVFGLL